MRSTKASVLREPRGDAAAADPGPRRPCPRCHATGRPNSWPRPATRARGPPCRRAMSSACSRQAASPSSALSAASRDSSSAPFKRMKLGVPPVDLVGRGIGRSETSSSSMPSCARVSCPAERPMRRSPMKRRGFQGSPWSSKIGRRFARIKARPASALALSRPGSSPAPLFDYGRRSPAASRTPRSSSAPPRPRPLWSARFASKLAMYIVMDQGIGERGRGMVELCGSGSCSLEAMRSPGLARG